MAEDMRINIGVELEALKRAQAEILQLKAKIAELQSVINSSKSGGMGTMGEDALKAKEQLAAIKLELQQQRIELEKNKIAYRAAKEEEKIALAEKKAAEKAATEEAKRLAKEEAEARKQLEKEREILRKQAVAEDARINALRLAERKAELQAERDATIAARQAEAAAAKVAKQEQTAVNSTLAAQASVTNKSQIAMMNFGYALQDASMFAVSFRGGLNAIGNNLPVMIQLFAQAADEAKATGTSLKQGLTDSLKGTGGLLIGINLVVLAAQVLPTIFEKIKSKQDKLATSVRALNKAYRESVFAAEANVAVVTRLTQVLGDNNATLDQKKNALGRIQEIYPEYLKGVDLDKVKQTELNSLLADGNELLRARAKTMALQEKLVGLYKEKMEIENKSLIETSKAQLLNSKIGYQAKMNVMDAMFGGTVQQTQKGGKYEYTYEQNGKRVPVSKEQMKLVEFAAANEAAKMVAKRATAGVDKEIAKTVEEISDTITNAPRGTYKPTEIKDKGSKGSTTTPDEYTSLEKLINKWDEKIAVMTNEYLILNANYEKAKEVWSLQQTTLKTQEEKDEARIDFLKSETEYKEGMAKLDREFIELEQKKTEQVQKRLEKEEEARRKAQEDLERSQAQLLKLKTDADLAGLAEWDNMTQLQIEKQEVLDAIDLDNYELKAERKAEITRKYLALEEKMTRDSELNKLNAISDALGGVASLFGQHTLAYKALMIGQATIDTYAAANKALAAYPPPFGAIAMAGVIASGLANVTNIIGTEITGFAKGGLIDKPTLALMGEAGAEIVAPKKDFMAYTNTLLQSNAANMSGEFRVKGTDLVLVMERASRRKANQTILGGVA